MFPRRIDHGTCDSTNEQALRALADGTAQHGDLHTATEQTRGRGQRGRGWWSAPDGGLFLSLIWSPSALPDPALLTMAAGLGVLDCVRAAGASGARLKWPNDVLVAGAKLAGILVEARALGTEQAACVVGVGLNVAQASFPAALLAEREVTSLGLLGVAAAPLDLAEPLAEALRGRLEAAAKTPRQEGQSFLEAAELLGREVEVLTGSGAGCQGILLGLEVEGPAPGTAQLLVQTAAGVQRAVAAHVQGVRALGS
ncbi:MAG: biotin--[acetyl-CoA-carboxylase] ligase [Planctomycetota bacterium]|nr:biotin--[acetyl-CoA-carboxylase] ligase [Planctomycetota bacterium]